RRRLPVDERRVYSGGFSGGARVASLVPGVVGRAIAGIIGCGAGLAGGLEPGEVRAAGYFGLTGLSDFNYEEMRRLDRAFDPTGLAHRFLFFEGGHDWPDPAFCARAVEWLEVAAMKAGLRPKDQALVQAAVARELDEAGSFERAGRVYWAVDRLEAAAALAAGLEDVPGLQERIAGLRSHRDYATFVRAEARRAERAADFRREFGGAFGAVEDDEAGGGAAVGAVLQELRIGILKREARSAKTPEARELASRLLFDFSFAAQARAMDLYAARDLVRAGAYFDLAIAACEAGLPRERYLYFNRACVAALAGDKRGALKFLSTAADKGFADAEALETSEPLRSVRDTDAFREIVRRIKKGSNPNSLTIESPHAVRPAWPKPKGSDPAPAH
ncbi:MAG TPA: hypothetical protein VLJ16_02435, partial [Acidobacteriota bacterium]|nr:hypothetical protein [Acidobacteriota bacterium]